MKITIWGARGSIPTPGPLTVKYGGNTTCIEVSLQDGTRIILDAGSGIRNLGKKIIEEGNTNDIYLKHQMEPPYFPARFSAMKAKFDFTHGIPVVKQIGSSTVTPIPLSHPMRRSMESSGRSTDC